MPKRKSKKPQLVIKIEVAMRESGAPRATVSETYTRRLQIACRDEDHGWELLNALVEVVEA